MILPETGVVLRRGYSPDTATKASTSVRTWKWQTARYGR